MSDAQFALGVGRAFDESTGIWIASGLYGDGSVGLIRRRSAALIVDCYVVVTDVGKPNKLWRE